MSSSKREEFAAVLRDALRREMVSTYQSDSASTFFQTKLLGKDRMALLSFIHSLNANLGSSIYKPMVELLAKNAFSSVAYRETVGKHITQDAALVIDKIMCELEDGRHRTPDKAAEIAEIRKACRGQQQKVRLKKADIKLIGNDGAIYLIDVKTAKLSASNIKAMKKNLLLWTAATLTDAPKAKVYPFIAIPYNLYAPEPYSRWKMFGMMDLDDDVKIADKFWAFLSGGEDNYDALLDIFEEVGIELRQEIDAYFNKYAP